MNCTIFHVLQVKYGFGRQWEVLVEGSNRKEILRHLREYRAVDSDCNYRIIQRKVDWIDYS